ncbi:MAG TPA: hypothetical protein VJ725_10325 [Thermoanaerobaculia bacterium]|nr:hypothetical protein [Thermoanaerobaculia bacterium]
MALDDAQREVLLEELGALAGSLRDPESRGPWEDLAEAVEAGAIGEPHLSRLEGLLEMSLQTGRARRIHGADSEQALLRLFKQTPRGTAARRATESVNEALSSLAGQTLESMLFTVQGPGVYRLGVAAGPYRLTLEIDRHGVTVESLEV